MRINPARAREVLEHFRKGRYGPEVMEAAHQELDSLAPHCEHIGEVRELSHYILSRQPEHYDTVVGAMKRNPTLAPLTSKLEEWGSDLEPEPRKTLFLCLMNGQPEQAHSLGERLKLLHLGMFMAMPDVQPTLGATAAREILAEELHPVDMLQAGRERLYMGGLLGGVPLLVAGAVARVESPLLRERLAPLQWQPVTDMKEAHQLLVRVQDEIARFEPIEKEARALLEDTSHQAVGSHEGRLMVGGTVLRRRDRS